MRWSWLDAVGLLLAWAVTTTPLAAATYFLDNLSKDGPIGPPAYLVPAAVGLVAAGLSSLAAVGLARSDPRLASSPYRLLPHAGCGLLAGLALTVSFCVWWGGWSLRFAERFGAG